MFDAMKTFAGPVKKTIGYVLLALVLIWFWTPCVHFVKEIVEKASGLFGGK